MDFVGNQKIIGRLNGAMAKGSVSQAYLFSGPESVGKHTVAKYFAASLVRGDHAISMDAEISTETMMDMIMIAPAIEEKKGVVKEKDISIETIREAQLKLGLFPQGGRYRVLIIDQAHKMGNGAQNALLKALEEPNSSSILILITDEEDYILPTLKSRCQRLNFALLDDHMLEDMIASRPLPERQRILSLSLGRPGILKNLLENPDLLERRTSMALRMRNASKGTLNEKFFLADELSKDDALAVDSLILLLWNMRKDAIADNNEKTYRVIEKVHDCIESLKRTNANSKLVLENLFLSI